MATMTVELPDTLMEQARSTQRWLPTIMELNLTNFQTPAKQVAQEVVEFLWSGPSSQQVRHCFLSPRATKRLQRLLALNEANLLEDEEELELDELEQIDYIVSMLKIDVAVGKVSSDV